MFPQRAVQLSMRRLAAANPSSLTKLPSIARIQTPSLFAVATNTWSRPAATTTVSNDDAESILAAQRRHRPMSPHLSIYRPQVTWIGSSLNRITGVALSGTFYLFGIAYLVAPTFGWHLESASIAAAFASWPVIAKILAKATFAWPFTYHSINGLRHLIWDTGSMFTNKQVIVSGWIAIGLSVASALALTFL